MKLVVVLSTILGLGLAAPSDARSGLQSREEVIASRCLIHGLCKPLKTRLEERKDPSAQKTYDSCKKNGKAVGKICDSVACTAIAATLNLNPPAAAIAAAICHSLGEKTN